MGGPTTNFPNGATSWGIPAGLTMHPALLRAAALNAKVIFLDPANSSGGNGKTAATAVTSLTDAYNKCTDGAGDVIIYLSTVGDTSASSRETETLTWSKDGITVIGACAPVKEFHRCRVAPSTTFAGPVITVSGNNNTFINFAIWQGHNAESHCLSVTGARNTFENLHIAGIGHASAGDDAASDSLLLDGAEENRFIGCTIGIDTVARSAACAEIRCANAAARNWFEGCTVKGFADNAGALWVDAASSGDIDRELSFEDCKFTNAIDSTATAMTVGMSVGASAGGTIYLLGKTARYGATDWSSNFANLAQCMLNSGTAATDMGAAINGS